jgi:hypothetical protein
MASQGDQDQKGIAYLNSKAWYRFLKVFYVLTLGATIGLAIAAGVISGEPMLILIPPIAVLLLLEIGKRSLYYVVTGKIFPNR